MSTKASLMFPSGSGREAQVRELPHLETGTGRVWVLQGSPGCLVQVCRQGFIQRWPALACACCSLRSLASPTHRAIRAEHGPPMGRVPLKLKRFARSRTWPSERHTRETLAGRIRATGCVLARSLAIPEIDTRSRSTAYMQCIRGAQYSRHFANSGPNILRHPGTAASQAYAGVWFFPSHLASCWSPGLSESSWALAAATVSLLFSVAKHWLSYC